jgi:hypothetical protein
LAPPGPSISENHKDYMSRLVRRLRRYFPAEAAGEIWREFRPALRSIHTPEAQEVGIAVLLCWCW